MNMKEHASKWVKYGFATTSQSRSSVTKAILPVLWSMKGTIILDLLEKGGTLYSASYWQHLSQNSLNS